MQNYDSLDYELSEKLLTKDISEITTVELPENCVNAMVEMHLPIVKDVASKLYSQTTENIKLEDMVTAGVLGLINAMDEFDPYSEARFTEFCIPYIQETIIDTIRYAAWLKSQKA